MGDKVPEYSLDADSKRRLRWLAKHFIGDGGWHTIYFGKGRSAGIPSMSKSIVDVWRTLEHWRANIDRICKKIENRDWRGLSAHHSIVNGSYTAYRLQPDTRNKKRLVHDWRGKWLYADRSLTDFVPETSVRSRLFACRARKINAAPLAFSWPIRAVTASNQAFWDKNFPFIKHHTTASQILSKLKTKRFVRFVDLDNHDVWIPPEVRDVLARRQGELFGHGIEWLYLASLRGPQVYKRDYYGERGVGIDGDVYDDSTWNLDLVNSTGFPGTSILATFAAVFDWYDAAVRAGLIDDTEAALIMFLKGQGRVACLAMGDNAALLADSEDDLRRWVEAVLYGKVSESESFLGLVGVDDGTGLSLLPDPTSQPIGFWMPSRPITAPLRGHWAVSYTERQPLYMVHPLYREIRAAERDVTRKHLGEDILDYARKNLPPVSARKAVSLVDTEFNMNPDVVHYKYSISELSEELLLQNFLPMSPEHFQPVLQAIGALRPPRNLSTLGG